MSDEDEPQQTGTSSGDVDHESIQQPKRKSSLRKSLNSMLRRSSTASDVLLKKIQSSSSSQTGKEELENILEGEELEEGNGMSKVIEEGTTDEDEMEEDNKNHAKAKPEETNVISGFFSRLLGGRSASTPALLLSKKRSATFDEKGSVPIVKVNVGGQIFSTSLGTLANGNSELLRDLFKVFTENVDEPRARDEDGNIFIDHDPKHFSTILNFLRANVPTALPEVGSREWQELRMDAEFYEIKALANQMDELMAKLQQDDGSSSENASQDEEITGLNPAAKKLIQKQGRELERMRVELHRLQFEKERAEAEGRPIFARLEFAYNLMVVGVTGTGKSSSLNTILNQQACEVSGSQAQGTRGCSLRDGVIDDKHFVSYLDTQGLGADTSVSDEELLEQIMLSTESIRQMGIINNILISFDLTTRTTPATIANDLTLCELFTELRRSCFVCFTKWNTNSVLSEWNKPLKTWVRKFRRVNHASKIDQDPPSYEEMYKCYCQYLLKSLSKREDGGAFAKIAAFLSFFESRVLWMYNLDPVQVEDLQYGDLEPYQVYLYEFYRKKSLIALKRGSTRIVTSELPFLRDDHDTMRSVAKRLISHRDKKLHGLESIGMHYEKRKRIRSSFTIMSNQAATNMEKKVYEVTDKGDDILVMLNKKLRDSPDVGCAMQ